MAWEPPPGKPMAPPAAKAAEGPQGVEGEGEGEGAPPASFAAYRDQLLDKLLALTPSWGRTVGLHGEYDGKLADYSKAGLSKRIAALEAADRTLGTFDASALEPDEALDLAILKSRVTLDLFNLKERKLQKTDPRFYEELLDVSGYINFEYGSLADRAAKLLAHEEAALAQMKHVIANLDPVLSKPAVETSIKVFSGYASYLRGDVKSVITPALDAAAQARFAKANEALAVAAEGIADDLEKKFLPKADMKSYVLDKERYLRFVAAQEGAPVDLAEFKALALMDLKRNKEAYQALGKKVKPTRPSKADLIAAATKLMDTSRQFILDKKLFTIPSEERCTVRETPPYMRWNAAFLNMPGPFDSAKQAYYYITLPDPTLPQKDQDEYIFPYGVLQATTVHEVYPGHFLQGLWTRKAPTRVQKMIDSYSFTEGWAHYTEQMMVEEGFGAADKQNHLGQLSDALLRNCRFVASIGLHTEGMTLEQAAQLFIDDCFQDKVTAREQAVRGTFDPGYFAYTVGKLQILALRDELKAELGKKFELRRFHDAILAHGSPPIALIRERVKQAMR
jgi:uncharacterized protein (DUF885 family)